ncbi:MAG TPA: glycosyltransferase family 2 protein [Candidatus Bathyarchaeia archaeon]|nr:glycosyltransferase family 2 protein [Candidatus Bathyarchaeia archaeon]
MTVSIIIVSFNTKNILEKCLGSLEHGCWGLKGSWEVVVVDNGSTDGSAEFLRQWQKENLAYQFIGLAKNYGFSKAVNQGIKKAEGKYLLLLNSDVICRKGAIVSLIKFTEKTESVGIVGGRLLNPDGTPQSSVFHLPTISGAVREFWLGQSGAFQKYLPDGDKPVIVEAVVGAVMLIPKQVTEKVGLFDKRFFLYFEDLDYCRRLRKAGFRIYYFPQAQFVHCHGASGKKTPGKVNSYLVQSSKIYHGLFRHYLINTVIAGGQKMVKLRKAL